MNAYFPRATWLSRLHRPRDGGRAFLRDYREGFRPPKDQDVEAYAEEFVWAAVSNRSFDETIQNEIHPTDSQVVEFVVEDEESLDVLDLL
jgi:hypothetical protein